jgi:hypothetical protein
VNRSLIYWTGLGAVGALITGRGVVAATSGRPPVGNYVAAAAGALVLVAAAYGLLQPADPGLPRGSLDVESNPIVAYLVVAAAVLLLVGTLAGAAGI